MKMFAGGGADRMGRRLDKNVGEMELRKLSKEKREDFEISGKL